VSTRALTPRLALALAAVGNLVGSFFGAKVASTVGKGIIDIHQLPAYSGLAVTAAALVGAIGWNLLTWWFGLPSSSSLALIRASRSSSSASRELLGHARDTARVPREGSWKLFRGHSAS
jgi:phosphate/sulfate permease